MFEGSLSAWHLWLIVGAILLTAEIFLPGFVLAGLGFAALCAAIVEYVAQDLGWALVGFITGALVFFVGIRPLALRTFMDSRPSPFGVQAMIGQQVVITDSPDVGGGLQAHFRDSTWSVESDDDLLEGDSAEIIGVKSTTLVVRRVPASDA